MTYRLSTCALSGLAALALAGAATAAEPKAEGGRPLSAHMTGPEEIPPGDPDGHGTGTFRVNPGQAQVCYELTVTGIAAANAAHIHVGAAGETGDPVVTLTAPTSGSSSGCASTSRETALAILKNPAGYYVNVHNADFPAGAVRGQLAAGK